MRNNTDFDDSTMNNYEKCVKEPLISVEKNLGNHETVLNWIGRFKIPWIVEVGNNLRRLFIVIYMRE